MGPNIKLIGTGLQSNQTYQSILTQAQIATLQISPDVHPFDGSAEHFALGVEALRLGLAYEYDPYFALSIARIDPLPHQLEAVYDLSLIHIFYRKFGIPSYRELPARRFEEAMRFLTEWYQTLTGEDLPF